MSGILGRARCPHRAADLKQNSKGRDGTPLPSELPLTGQGKGQTSSVGSLFSQLSTLNSQLLTVLLALCLLLATGCSRDARLERHLSRGQQFFKAERYDKAEIEFLNVLRLDQTNGIVLRSLGLTYYQQGKWLRSYAFLQKANEVAPNSNEVRLRLATILMALRNTKEARAHAEALLSQDPANEEALLIVAETAHSTNDISATRRRLEALMADNKAGVHLASGILDLRQGRTNEAAASFQRALSLDPKSSAAHLSLGNLAALSLNNTEAESHFMKAAELAPLRSPRRLHYSDFKVRSGDLAAAKASLEEITRLAPDYVPAYARLAEIALSERQFDRASTLSKKILTLDTGNYEGMLLAARVQIGKGDLRGALADFERLASAYPSVPTVHYHVAVAHLLNDNPARAASSLQQALALDPKHVDAILLLAEINVRQGNFVAAIATLKQLVQEHPQMPQAYVALARAHRAANELGFAAQVYEAMTKVFPRDPQPHFALGQLLVAQKKNDTARQQFERSVEISPGFLPAIEELANLDIAAGQFSAAAQRIADALTRNPQTPALHVLAARIHSAQKNYPAAEQALSRAIALDPNYDSAYLALARVYVDSNRPGAAVEKLDVLLARSTNNVAAWLQLGMIHHRSTNYTAARDAYEKLLAIDPRFFPALNNLASLYSEQLNQLDRAHALARRAREVRPDDAVIADTLGWILYKRGDYRSALPLLQESAEKLYKSTEVQFHLGMTYYMLGNESAARAALEKALASGEDFAGKAEAESRLALLSKSTEPLSVAALEKQLATSPRDPLLLTRLADAYERANAFDKAAATYNSAVQQNPRNVQAMLKLAELYAGPLRDSTKALETARKARSVAPEDRGVAGVLGRLAFQSGDYKWSLSLLEEAARGGASQPDLLYDLGWTRFAAGRVSEGLDAMKRALAVGKPFANENDAKRFVQMNTIALQPAKTNLAVAEIDSILKQERDYVPALFASAATQQRAGSAPIAREQYQAILKRFPDFIPAHKGLAILLSQTAAGSDAAFQHATRARENLPNDLEVARALGVIASHRKDYSRAAQLLKEYLAAAPQDAEALYYLGMAHFHLKENDASRTALRRAVALDGTASFVEQAKQTLADLK